jgi:RND family efflux transporter MFP subunit
MKKLFKKKWFRWVLIIVVVVVLGIVIFGGKGKKETVTATVQKGQIKEELILTGSIKADKHVVLYFPTGGKIAWVSAKEGAWVKKGQALTSLDKTVLNAAYMQALNNYRNYQAAAENTLDIVKDHSSDETFAQKATRTAAEVARDNAYDALTAAQYNLNNATLYAPFEGFITSLPFPSPGVNVSPADAQVELLDPASLYFEVEADQSEVTSIKEKMPVSMVLDSYREQTFLGIVSFVSYSPKAGEASTIYKVKVELEKNSLNDLEPRIGMSGDARFVLFQKDDALIVPSRFVNSDKDGKYVNLGKMGNKVRVSVGIEGENDIEITSGVKEGDILFD